MKKVLVFILSSILFGPSLYAIDKDKEVKETPLNFENEVEASAALLFLDLYNQGLAGGKTGICLNLDYDADGKPQYKAAFDTSAFVTGSSELKTGSLDGQGFNADNFKKLVDALARNQGGKVNASVDGYADGQHYSSKVFNVEESIKKNEKLSLDRASIIADLLKSNPNINIQQVAGHASPELERKYPKMSGGLNCPKRRKVIISFDQPTPQIKSEMSGSFFRAPEAMNKKVKDSIRQEFDANVRATQRALKIERHNSSFFHRRTDRENVQKIYDQLMADKKINPNCNLPPFKQMTLAMIENDITDFGNNSTKRKEGVILSYLNESGLKIKDIDGGRSALQEGCLMPSKSLADSMQNSVKDYAVSGSSFMSSAKLKTSDGKVTVGFDVKTLDPQKVQVGSLKGQKIRGFYCQACGNGLFFHEDSSGHFHPEYLDRVIHFSEGDKDQDIFINNLNKISDADPFSVAAFIKPRLFVVKNCKDCKCDHMALIKAKDASVISFDPLSGNGDASKQIPSSDFENACVIRPPVHHACNVRPNKNDGKDQATFQQKLTYESTIQNLKFQGSSVNELIKNVGGSCSADKKAMSANEKISNVMCSADQLRALPSHDEFNDCADEEAKLAN
jgi:hypothetical protein